MDKDTWLAENVFPKDAAPNERKLRLNVKSVEVFTASRKTSLTLCVLGSWAIYMPPYNLARLSSLTREAGYHTRVFDFNVESHYALKEANPDLADAWNGANYWWWQEPEYSTRIHPTYEPILRTYMEKILEEETDIIGFSTYYTNLHATEWMIKEIRKVRPNVTILMGGPQCHERNFEMLSEADYYFIGESEQNVLDFLNNWEQGIKPESHAIGSLYSDTRIDIDSLPYPDYSDFDLTKYWGKNSICAEISRGCIAKCSYCTEVYYWKFRDRGSSNVIDELEYQVNKYGINFVSFVDSLMNGNLKEFRKFCEGLVERNLGITWWGYARADGRMDLEFYKLMKAAGAQGFNYGIESGSDKVLKVINKKNTVAEINQNLIDSHKAGMQVSACWVIGAPGEDIEAFTHSFNMLWNHRHRILAVSPGPGLGDNYGSDYDNREKYNMNERTNPFLGGWYTLDMKNTRLHRMIRIKLMHIWLYLCKQYGGTITNVHTVGDITQHYSVDFDTEKISLEVDYEDFDYNIIQSEHGDFANSIMNEVFGLLRMLWRVKGGYEMTIDFNDLLDRQDFVFAMDPEKYSYTAKIRFKIDDHGSYSVYNTYKFVNNDKGVVDVEDFEYTYESSGVWTSSKKTGLRKIFYIATDNRPTELTLESCFSSMGIAERKLLHEIARNTPANGDAVDIGQHPGGRTAIIANANKTLNVVTCNPFPITEEYPLIKGFDEPWLLTQLTNMSTQLSIPEEKLKTLLDNLKRLTSEDSSGITARKFLLDKFTNISNIIDPYTDPKYYRWPKSIDLVLFSLPDTNRLLDNLTFFSKILNQEGKMLVHQYGSDDKITLAVDMFLNSYWKISNQVEGLIVIERAV